MRSWSLLRLLFGATPFAWSRDIGGRSKVCGHCAVGLGRWAAYPTAADIQRNQIVSLYPWFWPVCKSMKWACQEVCGDEAKEKDTVV